MNQSNENQATLKKARVKLYVTHHCPYCIRAKKFLESKGVTYELIDLTNKPEELAQLKMKTHWKTVPQIFVGSHFVGGYTDMMKLEDDGTLDQWLAEDSV
jgi:glutaredoxin 3